MTGYLVRPRDEGVFPGVVVSPELFGVDATARRVCDRLASFGLVVLAPDLHHRTEPRAELPRDETGRERGFALLRRMTRAQAIEDVTAAVDHLNALGCPRVSMVGLSLGGHVAYLAATAIPLDIAVLYPGWLPTVDIPLSRPEPTLDLTPKISGRVLFLVGEDDHLIPADQRERIAAALKEAGVRHELVAYPGIGHAFLGTSPEATEDVWRRLRAFLA